jgi:hypothetical protein
MIFLLFLVFDKFNYNKKIFDLAFNNNSFFLIYRFKLIDSGAKQRVTASN